MRSAQPRRAGAKASRTGLISKLVGWAQHHGVALRFSLDKFIRNPVSSAMTSLVIAIALALPAALSMLVGNVQSISAGWDVTGNVTLYLNADIDDGDGAALAREMNDHPAIESTRFIGRDEALATFRQLSGFGDVLDALDDNPLPAAIVLRPKTDASTADQLEALAVELQQHPTVETAQVDLEWVQRLNAMLEFIQRGVLVVAAMLGLAVLLVVGNTIRLDVHARRDEIVVIKLIGATDAFVRRPFLYGGLIYGLCGGLLSALLVMIALTFLDSPSSYLASLYGSQAELVAIDFGVIAALILSSALLGLIGSWLSVGRHLREIEPR